MTDWTSDELARIGNAEELEIASLRADGTMRPSRTIWVVRVGDALYVRSVRGRESDWFRGVQSRHQGEIQAGGVTKAVDFVELPEGDAAHEAIDAAYRAKYRRYAASIIQSTVTPAARSATLQLHPR